MSDEAILKCTEFFKEIVVALVEVGLLALVVLLLLVWIGGADLFAPP